MPHKLTVGLSEKIGQPNFGSLGASCALELELTGEDLARSDAIAEKVKQAYAQCRQRIDEELAPHRLPARGGRPAKRPAASDPRASRVDGRSSQPDCGQHDSGQHDWGQHDWGKCVSVGYPPVIASDRGCRQARKQRRSRNQTALARRRQSPTASTASHDPTSRQRLPASLPRQSEQAPRPATAAQVRAMRTIASKAGVSLSGQLEQHFGVQLPGDLSLQQASHMIDVLQSQLSPAPLPDSPCPL